MVWEVLSALNFIYHVTHLILFKVNVGNRQALEIMQGKEKVRTEGSTVEEEQVHQAGD